MKFQPLKKTLKDSMEADRKRSPIASEEVDEILVEGLEVAADKLDEIVEEYEGTEQDMLRDSIFYLKAMSVLYATVYLKKDGTAPGQSELMVQSGKLIRKYEQLNGKVL